jgi:DNA-directed RNA polymerase specialized sigma24 family protein
MVIVVESARAFRRFVSHTSLKDFARQIVIRMALAFMRHRRRMSCSSAAGVIASDTPTPLAPCQR